MESIIKIKCPFDGAVLSVKNQPGIEGKSVTCPVCKNTYPFTQFRRITSNVSSNDPDTEYPKVGESPTFDEKTEISNPANYTLGKIAVIGSGQSYQLKPGRNIIGRKGQKSEANFQIDTAEKHFMSREHIVIEVKKLPIKGYVHYVSLYKEKVNKTFIGNEPLLYGDCLVLHHGDLIKLPDATLRFEIPDEDETDINI
jgi:hypothetical protein